MSESADRPRLLDVFQPGKEEYSDVGRRKQGYRNVDRRDSQAHKREITPPHSPLPRDAHQRMLFYPSVTEKGAARNQRGKAIAELQRFEFGHLSNEGELVVRPAIYQIASLGGQTGCNAFRR